MDNRVVVITGGSDGLGKATAKKLIASGYTVIIISPNEEKLKNAASELGCEYRVCDVSDYDQTEQCFKDIISSFKRIDILINSAGLWIEGELVTIEPQKIKRIIEVNTLGTIFSCREVIPYMKQSGSGVILNVISQGGLLAKPNRSVYYASKWALTGFTKSLELELDPSNIKVIGLYPGTMKTGMFSTAGINKDTSKGLDVDEVAKVIDFTLSLGAEVEIPSLEIKNPKY